MASGDRLRHGVCVVVAKGGSRRIRIEDMTEQGPCPVVMAGLVPIAIRISELAEQDLLPPRHGRARPYRMHRSWNRSAAAIATSSWPGLSGRPMTASAATDGPNRPGHDGGETLAAIEQAFDFMGFHSCFRNVCIP